MNEGRNIEAVVILANAMNNLLTAACYIGPENDLLTEAQHNAMHRALDVIDLNALHALRKVVGLQVVSDDNLTWEMNHDLRFHRGVS